MTNCLFVLLSQLTIIMQEKEQQETLNLSPSKIIRITRF